MQSIQSSHKRNQYLSQLDPKDIKRMKGKSSSSASSSSTDLSISSKKSFCIEDDFEEELRKVLNDSDEWTMFKKTGDFVTKVFKDCPSVILGANAPTSVDKKDMYQYKAETAEFLSSFLDEDLKKKAVSLFDHCVPLQSEDDLFRNAVGEPIKIIWDNAEQEVAQMKSNQEKIKVDPSPKPERGEGIIASEALQENEPISMISGIILNLQNDDDKLTSFIMNVFEDIFQVEEGKYRSNFLENNKPSPIDLQIMSHAKKCNSGTKDDPSLEWFRDLPYDPQQNNLKPTLIPITIPEMPDRNFSMIKLSTNRPITQGEELCWKYSVPAKFSASARVTDA